MKYLLITSAFLCLTVASEASDIKVYGNGVKAEKSLAHRSKKSVRLMVHKLPKSPHKEKANHSREKSRSVTYQEGSAQTLRGKKHTRPKSEKFRESKF